MKIRSNLMTILCRNPGNSKRFTYLFLPLYLIYISIQTLLLWDSKLSSGASCFHWSSLMFLQLDWSPPVVHSIDWTWFGKAHTCLYKVPQLTVHVRAKAKPWGRRNCPWSSETGLFWGTDMGKGTKKCLQHWSSPRTQLPPSFLNGRIWNHQDSS